MSFLPRFPAEALFRSYHRKIVSHFLAGMQLSRSMKGDTYWAICSCDLNLSLLLVGSDPNFFVMVILLSVPC